MNILQINTSLHGAGASSTKLANAITAHFANNKSVVLRDLGAHSIPHITGHGFDGFAIASTDRDLEQRDTVALSDTLIAELETADVIVLGLPMYNYGIPSALKAWIDHVARVGVTFQYTESGPQGLLKGKRLIVATTRGGLYTGVDTPKDIPTDYIPQIFAFIGVENVEFIYAEGMATDNRNASIDNAMQQINQLTASADSK